MSTYRFTLNESSGPVSPRHQYALSVVVEAASDGSARVAVSCQRPQAAGGPREAHADLDPDRFQALCRAIDAGPWAFHDVVPEGPRRVGISVNTVTLQWPDRPSSSFRYTLHGLDDPPHAREHGVVEVLRSLGMAVVGD